MNKNKYDNNEGQIIRAQETIIFFKNCVEYVHKAL